MLNGHSAKIIISDNFQLFNSGINMDKTISDIIDKPPPLSKIAVSTEEPCLSPAFSLMENLEFEPKELTMDL